MKDNKLAKGLVITKATATEWADDIVDAEESLLEEFDETLFDRWAKLYDSFLVNNDFEAVRPQLTETAFEVTEGMIRDLEIVKITRRPFGVTFLYCGLAFSYELHLTKSNEIESTVKVVTR